MILLVKLFDCGMRPRGGGCPAIRLGHSGHPLKWAYDAGTAPLNRRRSSPTAVRVPGSLRAEYRPHQDQWTVTGVQ